MGSDTKATSTVGGGRGGAHVTASFLTETSFVNWRTNHFLSTQGLSILTKIKCLTSPWRFLNGRKLPSCTTKHLWLVQIGFVEKKKTDKRKSPVSVYPRGPTAHLSKSQSWPFTSSCSYCNSDNRDWPLTHRLFHRWSVHGGVFNHTGVSPPGYRVLTQSSHCACSWTPAPCLL